MTSEGGVKFHPPLVLCVGKKGLVLEGLNINNNTIKLSMYADDMTGLVIRLKSVT